MIKAVRLPERSHWNSEVRPVDADFRDCATFAFTENSKTDITCGDRTKHGSYQSCGRVNVLLSTGIEVF